jgi:hypothetical protein
MREYAKQVIRKRSRIGEIASLTNATIRRLGGHEEFVEQWLRTQD